jgi:hypothetical protein
MNIYTKLTSKEEVLAYFMALFPNLTGGAEENHKNSGLRAENRIGNRQNAKQWQMTTTL